MHVEHSKSQVGKWRARGFARRADRLIQSAPFLVCGSGLWFLDCGFWFEAMVTNQKPETTNQKLTNQKLQTIQ
jgi:hypothetical protein